MILMMVSFGMGCHSIFMPPHGDPHRHRSLSIRSQFLATYCRYENLIWCLEPRLNRLSQQKTHLEFQQVWNPLRVARCAMNLLQWLLICPMLSQRKHCIVPFFYTLSMPFFFSFPFHLTDSVSQGFSSIFTSTLEEEGEPFIT